MGKRTTIDTAQVIESVVFTPSPIQRKAKAAFWYKWNEHPFGDPADITAHTASDYAGYSQVREWWADSRFKEWFLNRDEFRQRVEYLANLALDTAEEILLDPDASAGARVSMVKLAAELASKMPQKGFREMLLDESIQKMNKEELEKFILDNTKRLVGE